MPLPYVTPKKLEQEIVTVKAELEKEIEQKSELPEVTSEDKNKFLHTNETTGNLEWSEVASGGTDVVANPEGEATVQLTKLQVEDTVYSIPQGGGNTPTAKTLAYVACPENLDGSHEIPGGSSVAIESAVLNKTKFAAHLNDIIPNEFLTFDYSKDSELSEDSFEIDNYTRWLYLGAFNADPVPVTAYGESYFVAGRESYVCRMEFDPEWTHDITSCCGGTLKLYFYSYSNYLQIDVPGIDCTNLNLPDTDHGSFILSGIYRTAWLNSLLSALSEIDTSNVPIGEQFPDDKNNFKALVQPINILQLGHYDEDIYEAKKQFDYPLNLDYLRFIDFTWGSAS